METQIKPQNTIIENYTEFVEIDKKGKAQHIELRGEVYENYIHRGSEEYGAPHSQVLVIEERENGKHVVGQVLYVGKISADELKSNVKEIKENPTKYMWDDFANEYK